VAASSPTTFVADDAGLVVFARRLAQTSKVPGRQARAVEATAGQVRLLGFDHVGGDDVGDLTGTIGSGRAPRLLVDGHIGPIPLHSAEHRARTSALSSSRALQ
jgi:hypothetical protein